MDRFELKRRAEEMLHPLSRWSKQCHAASFELVKSGLAGRVARGGHPLVPGQHSWAVVGMDCYDPDGLLIDPVLWSYSDEDPFVLVSKLSELGHRPHGAGNIWAWGRPPEVESEPLALTPSRALSSDAITFLDLLGPLDRRGWSVLAHAPVEGWPAGEILAAIRDTEELEQIVPIDIIGMLTDYNPGGVYLKHSRQAA